MKIALVEPEPTFNAYYFARLPMLGPLYLGTILKERGHEVRVLSGCLEKVYDRRRRWLHPAILEADVVGLTALTASAPSAYEIGDELRRQRPATKIVLGGPHASYVWEEAAQHADVVVRGEGEPAIVEAVEDASRGSVLDGALVPDLDTLPIPDLSLLGAAERRMTMATLSASRGCPHGCNFCVVSRLFGRKHRARSPESVLEELELRQRQGYRRVMFSDDNFAGNRRWTIELLEGMLRRGIRMHWVAQARVEAARDPEIVGLMARTHCSLLMVGLESVNPATLREYGKHQSVEQVAEAVAVFRKHDITVCGMFILGADNDDFSVLFPIPGTPLFERLEREGRILTRDWSLFDGSHVVFQPAKFQPAELQRWYVWAWKKCYGLLRRSPTWYRFQRPFEWAALRWMVRRWRKLNRGYLRWLRRQPALGHA